jgi:hypothetical protein
MLRLKKIGKTSAIAGGGSILGLFGGGCFACGIPLISILGISASTAYLPFRGFEIAYLSIGVLSISLYLMLKNDNMYCKIVRRK